MAEKESRMFLGITSRTWGGFPILAFKKRTGMRRFALLMSLILFASCASEKTPVDSPLTASEIRKLQDANTIEDIFDKESEIQLSTSAECAIALITDIEVDAKGNYIVADGWQQRAVFIFGHDGKFLKELGKQGQGPGEYSTPVSIDISSKQEILVADYLANKIHVYDENYNFIRSIICKPKIYHFIHLNSRDEIFIYSGAVNPFRKESYNTIRKYDNQGKEIHSFAPLPEEVLDVKFSATQDGMTIDKNDFIYEMNPLHYNVRKFTPEGDLAKSFTRKTLLFKIITEKGQSPIVVYGPYYLDKGLIMAQVSEHLEIYDTEGNFMVGELPFSSKIIGTHGNCLLIRHWEESKKPEDQPNPKIIWLKLKI
jgi:hypothetical protein